MLAGFFFTHPKMFASDYLKKQNRKRIIEEAPVAGLGLIVIIPCLREPAILETLKSLAECEPTKQKTEVIVLINHPEDESDAVKQFNTKTHAEIVKWIALQKNPDIGFYCTGPFDLPKKWAGVGVARKYAMDEAVRRFNDIDNPAGIIVSLDADTLVERNYLAEIERYFAKNPEHAGCTIDFEHQKNQISSRQLEGIELYEKYLHYYRDALEYAGYPWPLITIGSAFAVTATAYIKRGGMTRRKAGEDFYFLQNLVLVGTVGTLNSTKVHPSARESDRVPFGTGPAIAKWMNNSENLGLTYNLEIFKILRHFFAMQNEFYKTGETGYLRVLAKLEEPVRQFLLMNNFQETISELNQNCGSAESFEKRFFQKFNAFMILKFVHFATDYFFPKANLTIQHNQLKSLLIKEKGQNSF